MKKLPILSLFLVLVLVLAACGPADTEPDGTPGVGTPDAFATPSEPMDTPAIPDTPQMAQEVTPEETVEVTPPATPETTPDEDETPVAGEPPGDNPRRASNLLNFDVRNNENQTIGTVEELIVSLNGVLGQSTQQTTTEQQQATPASPELTMGEGEHLSYVIVNVGGFLGLGQRQVAIPFEHLQLQTGEDENDYAFYIDINQDELESLPEVDLNKVIFTNQDWDMNLRSGWDIGAGGTPDVQTTPSEQTTPSVVDTTPTPVETAVGTPVGTMDESEQAGMHIYALRVSVLLGSEVYDEVAVAPGRAGQATPTPAAGETPAEGTETTPTTAGTVLDRETVVASVEDLIVDPDTGEVEYAILDADDNLELGDRWIPVPLRALNILGADDLLLGMGIEYLVKVDRQQFAEAPSFEVGTLPVTEDPGWDAGVREYWGVQ